MRELENVVERAVVLSSRDLMDADLLPESVRTKELFGSIRFQLSDFAHSRGPPRSLPGEPGARVSSDCSAPSLFQMRYEIELRVICDMLEHTGWNQTEAAERFQIPLSTLNQKYGSASTVRACTLGGRRSHRICAANGECGGGVFFFPPFFLLRLRAFVISNDGVLEIGAIELHVRQIDFAEALPAPGPSR